MPTSARYKALLVAITSARDGEKARPTMQEQLRGVVRVEPHDTAPPAH